MKNIYFLVLACLAAAFPSQAQNLVAQNPTSYVVGYTDDTLASHVDIVNTGGAALDVLVQRVTNNLAPNHESYFCWGQYCYSPAQSLSPYSENIPSGATNSTFIGYLDPKLVTGISTVTYCFYDQQNIQDSACVEFTYEVKPLGIAGTSAPAVYMSDPTPNPARGMTALAYGFAKPVADAAVVLRGVTGRIIARHAATGTQGTVVVRTRDLSPGLYLLSLEAGTWVLDSRMLVVAGD